MIIELVRTIGKISSPVSEFSIVITCRTDFFEYSRAIVFPIDFHLNKVSNTSDIKYAGKYKMEMLTKRDKNQ